MIFLKIYWMSSIPPFLATRPEPARSDLRSSCNNRPAVAFRPGREGGDPGALGTGREGGVGNQAIHGHHRVGSQQPPAPKEPEQEMTPNREQAVMRAREEVGVSRASVDLQPS